MSVGLGRRQERLQKSSTFGVVLSTRGGMLRVSTVEDFMAQVEEYRAAGKRTGPLVFFPYRLPNASDEVAIEVCLRVIETHSGRLPDELTLAAVELERRGALTALPRILAAEAGGSHWLAIQVRALQALASGDGCSCEAYKRSGQERVGPHMKVTEKLNNEGLWTFVHRGVCDLCGDPWELRFEHRGRGGNIVEWE